MPTSKIIRNSARCRKCGHETESKHRHDYVECPCGAIAVDGGRDYLKRTGNREDIEETSIIEKSPTNA